MKKEEDDLFNDCDDYYSDSYSYENKSCGPDWLGGVETEEEFWEHT